MVVEMVSRGFVNTVPKKETKGIFQMAHGEKAGQEAAERYRKGWT